LAAIFVPKILSPWAPSTYRTVFTVSTGVRKILKVPAVKEPPAAFKAMGRSFVTSKELLRVRNNVFEKVSPNLDNGP
jgi:hypothetical protein